MGVGAGLSDGRAEIRRAALRIRQEDWSRARHRTPFGARLRKKIAPAFRRCEPCKGRLTAPFLCVGAAACACLGGKSVIVATANTSEDRDEPHCRQSNL